MLDIKKVRDEVRIAESRGWLYKTSKTKSSMFFYFSNKNSMGKKQA